MSTTAGTAADRAPTIEEIASAMRELQSMPKLPRGVRLNPADIHNMERAEPRMMGSFCGLAVYVDSSIPPGQFKIVP